MPIDSSKNDILDKLKVAFTGGAIHPKGVFFNAALCRGILQQLTRYIQEESSESWQESIEEMQRITKWQIEMLGEALRASAFDVHTTSIATEDQSNFKIQFRHDIQWRNCKHPKCVTAKEALREVGIAYTRPPEAQPFA